MIFIVDPSVVAKWYFPEILGDRAEALKIWLLEEAHSIAAPELFLLEMANLLWKKSALLKEIPSRTALRIYEEVSEIGVRLYPDKLLLPYAMEISLMHRSPVYDSLYLTLARQLNTTFITADQRLKKNLEGTRWVNRIQLLSQWQR